MTIHTSAAGQRGILFARAQGNGPDAVLAQLGQAFEEFKKTHAEELAGIKAQYADVVTAEKLERINAQVGELQAALDQQAIRAAARDHGPGAPAVMTEADRAYAQTFDAFVRGRVDENAVKAAMRVQGVSAAYSVGSDSDGGYTAPVEWDRTITDKLVLISPMRQFAAVQTVTGRGFKRLYNIGGTSSGWVGETATRPETNSSQLAEYGFAFGEIYAQPAATNQILEDSEINIAAWLASEVNTEFARQEGVAFISGDGVNKPTGLLNYDAAAEAARPAAQRHPLGAVEEIKTGAAAALTSDGLIDLTTSLPAERRAGAALYANRLTYRAIRKLKDGDGNYLWQPSYQAGQPATLNGEPVRELSGLPNVAANAIPIVYGNMAEAYRIFDRTGVSVLRDAYTRKPYVLFYTTRRVGGGLWNPEWMRYHRVAA
ncbi:phage major capsid protein [Pannonibacter sp. SL95]|uniref:phage major capsid protein n=1 Tax=Pannonibacter sp. SL95 TaxID=2995153 RepID=UPI0022735E6A|nr:phage major capsid protein [Pannonibacter sp. SL95]MCY1704492.1 phage major capsid protein [Pannonibacter sp. SL95]